MSRKISKTHPASLDTKPITKRLGGYHSHKKKHLSLAEETFGATTKQIQHTTMVAYTIPLISSSESSIPGHDQYDERKQQHKQQQQPTEQYIQIIPSDQAYVDIILDQGAFLFQDNDDDNDDDDYNNTITQELRWEDLVEIDTSSLKIHSNDGSSKEICLVVTHTVKYKNEPIWKLQTKSVYGVTGSSGESALCTFMKSRGIVRSKIIHKRRTCLGEGCNNTEYQNHDIVSMLFQSGEARQQELYCQQ